MMPFVCFIRVMKNRFVSTLGYVALFGILLAACGRPTSLTAAPPGAFPEFSFPPPAIPQTAPGNPLSPPPTEAAPQEEPLSLCSEGEKQAQEVCELVNRTRVENGLVPIKLSSRLNLVASIYASHMRQDKFFAHVAPDGATIETRLKSGAISYRYAGENIAKGHTSAEAVTKDWLRSPGHRANILQPEYRRMGLGFSGYIWVQIFTD